MSLPQFQPMPWASNVRSKTFRTAHFIWDQTYCWVAEFFGASAGTTENRSRPNSFPEVAKSDPRILGSLTASSISKEHFEVATATQKHPHPPRRSCNDPPTSITVDDDGKTVAVQGDEDGYHDVPWQWPARDQARDIPRLSFVSVITYVSPSVRMSENLHGSLYP
ncbi:hypothetical protein EDB92DRAFT_1814965 [Lactarius akahatsu]|uniref:Uncharacterized protein n=1 Tax=Lactarius akahatsu TaxID=416441 RepID=A0AAD4LQA7_9AGAM|nr:hypothetical protein EDB92DRAFT_1814965 [Lactarius akahatsu]